MAPYLSSALTILLLTYLAIALFHRAIRSAGFPLFAAAAATFVFNLPQGREVFYGLAEEASVGHFGPIAWAMVGMLVLSGVCWYTARRILYAPPDTSELVESPAAQTIRAWWPRIAAGLPWLGAAIAFAAYPARNGVATWAYALAVVSLLVAGGLVLVTWLRGFLFEPSRFTPSGDEVHKTWRWLLTGIVVAVLVTAAIWLRVGGTDEILPIASTYLGLLLVFLLPHQLWIRCPWRDEAQRHRAENDPEWIVHQPKLPWWLVAVALVAWLVVVYAAQPSRTFAFRSSDLAGYGTIALFCLGWSGVVLFFSALSFWVARDRRISGAALGAMLVLWVTFLAGTGMSDNHRLWRASEDGLTEKRRSVEGHLTKWLRDRREHEGLGQQADKPIPFVLVAAHGGGLRAAYWTAIALAGLEARSPGFHCNVFALSTISGSSLGALVWHANLKRAEDVGFRCTKDGQEALAAKVDGALAHDYLAGLVAGFLGPDLTGHFVPGADAPDRQVYFESAWARAVGTPLMQGDRPLGLLQVVRPDPTRTELPALFLVAADARDGRRVIASDLAFDENLLKNAADLLSLPEMASVSAVTAAAASARFPWISPQSGAPDEVRLLDGGVFEATGAEVVNELLRALAGWCDPSGEAGVLSCFAEVDQDRLCNSKRATDGACQREASPIFVRPLALQLVNAPLEGLPPEPKLFGSPELVGPIVALNAARGARGAAAWKTLQGDPSLFAGAGTGGPLPFARFALDCERRPDSVTLTWTLSAERREHMRTMADQILAGKTGRLTDRQLQAWLSYLEGGAPTADAGGTQDSCVDAS